MRNKMLWVMVLGLLVVLLSACVGASTNGLQATVSGLETQVANQEEWISYQATQIGHNQMILAYLATRVPDAVERNDLTITPTPYVEDSLTGSVEIHGGGCCVGGVAGTTIPVEVRFEAQSVGGEVVEMKVLITRTQIISDVPSDVMADAAWEPFSSEKTFLIDVPTNWTSFWVYVQYRDSRGVISQIYSDDIAVEGMPQTVSPTP